MYQQVIDKESIKNLTDLELERLSNAAWSQESLGLSWLCDEEWVRRRREREINIEN